MLRKSDVWRRQSRRRCGASPGADVGRASPGSFLVVMRALPRMQPTKGQRGRTSIATSIIALQHCDKHHSIATSIIALQHRNRHEKPAGARPSSRPQCLLRRQVPALRPPETHRMPLLSCEQFGSEASPRPATAASDRGKGGGSSVTSISSLFSSKSASAESSRSTRCRDVYCGPVHTAVYNTSAQRSLRKRMQRPTCSVV